MRQWLGARLPFCAFCIILGSFTYTYHIFPWMPWIIVFVCLNFAVLVTWPQKGVGLNR